MGEVGISRGGRARSVALRPARIPRRTGGSEFAQRDGALRMRVDAGFFFPPVL